MILHLTQGHIDAHGGYEYDYTWVGRTLVVAALDNGKERNRTQVERYTESQLLRWFDRAAKFREPDGRGEDFMDFEEVSFGGFAEELWEQAR